MQLISNTIILIIIGLLLAHSYQRMSSSDFDTKVSFIKKYIDDYPDFPKPGILFRDIFGVFREPKAFETLKEVLVEFASGLSPKVQCVVGLDARGFLLGPLIALELKIPFVPIRKKGKLPGDKQQIEYTLEYGKDIFEIQTKSIGRNDQVLLVDDLLATGGTMAAATQLIEKIGAQVSACLVVIELTDLKGREKIKTPVHALIKY